ncbi:hypothetical protein RJ55_02518 [Drechmeria coniospora]|nr:hypothetical protein RJ55_02518 [Drechmeria coniospora]
MVGVINPASDTLAAYQSGAAASTGTTRPAAAFGGVVVDDAASTTSTTSSTSSNPTLLFTDSTGFVCACPAVLATVTSTVFV